MTDYVIMNTLPGFSGQYGEILHSCAVFSLGVAYSSGKCLYTLVQHLAILPTNPGSRIYLQSMYALHRTEVGKSTNT